MRTTRSESGHFHAVKFYKDAESLADIVCTFVAQGLQGGEPALLLATPEHVRYFRACFGANGIDVDAATARGSLIVLDAHNTLEAFMREGIPMPSLFRNTMMPVLDRIAARHPGANIRAYGEMVDVLWKHDQTAAAIRLEMLWNDLARSHRFGLLCGYAMGNFYKGASTDEICNLHSHVVSETGSRVSLA
jgi:hypothetical protein